MKRWLERLSFFLGGAALVGLLWYDRAPAESETDKQLKKMVERHFVVIGCDPDYSGRWRYHVGPRDNPTEMWTTVSFRTKEEVDKAMAVIQKPGALIGVAWPPQRPIPKGEP